MLCVTRIFVCKHADPDYATRAGHNNVHFLLSLETPNENSGTEYAFECIKEGAELNALAIYVWYHYSALKKMNKIATGKLTQTERSALILAALADEGFALHFLKTFLLRGMLQVPGAMHHSKKAHTITIMNMGLKQLRGPVKILYSLVMPG
jgi:hypothetical protein